MDNVSKKMDFLVNHWHPFDRHFPAAFSLITVCYVQAKRDWVRTKFNTCNFSLILKGRGEFRRGGQIYEVQSPCVITQWPGDDLEYGPPIPEETWDELYLIYSAKLMPKFKRSGLIDLRRPIWPIANLVGVQLQIEELRVLASSDEPERVVDRVDRVAERLIMETLLPAGGIRDETHQFQELLAGLRRNLGSPTDFSQMAEECGMSASTFRRRWEEVVSLPPAQYLLQLRIQEACRVLAETTKPIHEVANLVGFEDEYYFSRRFRIRMGMAPREYRKAYQILPAGAGPGAMV